jgi:hypothetical protein
VEVVHDLLDEVEFCVRVAGHDVVDRFVQGRVEGVGPLLHTWRSVQGGDAAIRVHDPGNMVVIAGRRQSVLDEVASSRPAIDTVVLDIADPASIKASIADVVRRHPALNVLINNAGTSGTDDPSTPLDDAQAERLVQTNLLGSLRVSSALVEHLKTQPHAAIIYNTSTLAFVPIALTAAYSATKAALHSYPTSMGSSPPSIRRCSKRSKPEDARDHCCVLLARSSNETIVSQSHRWPVVGSVSSRKLRV